MKYSFYHITDRHNFLRKIMTGSMGVARWKDRIAMREMEEILKKALRMVLQDGELVLLGKR